MAEETATNFGFTNYTWGLELISRVDFSTGVPIYFVHDGHGSVRELTSPSGAITDTYDYDAFGNLLRSTGSTPNNYLFAGEQFDPNLNLYYNRARYLATTTGRFWSMDTYEGDDEDPTTLHKYAYVADEPTDRTDQSGNDFDIGSAVEAIDIGVTLSAFPTLTTNGYQQGGSAEPRIATAQSDRGLEFLKWHEGRPGTGEPLLKPDDHDGSATGNCTIGWGAKIHSGRCKPEDYSAYANFTKEAAEQRLFTDVMDKALIPIKRRVRVGLAQRELDALIDFTFNLGGVNLGKSDLLQQLNAGNYKQAGEGFLG